jgi:xanthine dehydrogenase small subunit
VRKDEASVIRIVVDGQVVTVRNDAMTLLDVLREAGATSVKDGCAPQGQCGCCTVLVDGAPRVSCVTPVRRMDGREIVTVDGLDAARRDQWAHAFVETGGSQCGFCTPGIICRLEGLAAKGGDLADKAAVDRALQAHLCRCTGWATIREAAVTIAELGQLAVEPSTSTPHDDRRDFEAASVRAGIEGRAKQYVGPHVAMGRGGFADDIAPADALVAVPGGDGWVIGESLFEARALAGKIQGRRTTLDPIPPIDVAPGDWAVSLQTGWVEPAYLEPDAAWCVPGGGTVVWPRNGSTTACCWCC